MDLGSGFREIGAESHSHERCCKNNTAPVSETQSQNINRTRRMQAYPRLNGRAHSFQGDKDHMYQPEFARANQKLTACIKVRNAK